MTTARAEGGSVSPENTGGDPTADAARLEELAVIAPAEDLIDARRLADAVGARCVGLSGPSGVPAAVADALA